MSLEDPRIKYRQLQNERVSNESIPMQPVHGSPYHVYPTSSYPPAVQAFQAPIGFNVNNHNNSMTSSPLLVTKLQQQMEMSPVFRNGGSPHSARIISQLAATSKQNVQETSFITPAETDAAVAKINSMFPTASESHIRLLLKKYYNREAVVISALQVEKHPLTTPGPFSTPPPPIRHNSTFGMNSFVTMTPPMGGRFEQISSTGSPIPRPASATASAGSYGSPRVGGDAYRSSPKPHSSPKMKLRYLKSIFPKAEETLLLDILANADNNVQKASEQLLSMGYEKRDTTAPRLTNRQREAEVMRQQIEAENTPPPQPKLKTTEDKKKVKAQLQNLYKDIPGRIITMALDSVDYSEEKAVQILQIVMQQEDGKNNGNNQIGDQTSTNNVAISSSTSTQNTGIAGSKSVQRTSPTSDDSVHNPGTPKNKNSEFKSVFERIQIGGANPELYNGPNDDVLLVDYIAWSGANPDLCIGQKGLALGPDKSIRNGRTTIAHGPNKDLYQGAKVGLSKGSLYSQIKCN